MLNREYCVHKNRGFVIFIVAGIIGIVGLMMLSIHWYSSQRNTQSHKTRFNECARQLARSGVHLLFRELRNGTSLSYSAQIAPLINNKNSSKSSFYSYFLLPAKSLNEVVLDHDDIYGRFSDEGKKLFSNLLSSLPGGEIEYSMRITTFPIHTDSTGRSPLITDPVEKQILMEIDCKGSYRGASKTVRATKQLRVQSLIPAITSRFTLFHKNNIRSTYNRFVTDSNGQSSGFEKPLVLFNHQTTPPALPDEQLLEPHGPPLKSTSYKYLAELDSLEKSKAEILASRGYLYFGSSPENTLRLIHGMDAKRTFTQYHHLYPPKFIITSETSDSAPMDLPAAIQMNAPSFFDQDIAVQNVRSDSSSFESYGSLLLMSQYSGFYEEHAAVSPADMIPDYRPGSSLIMQFGTIESPSRTYTVGESYQEVVQMSSVAIDRDNGNDEQDQVPCANGKPVYRRDARLAFLKTADEFNWGSPYATNPLILNPQTEYFPYPNSCNQPVRLMLPSSITYENMFPDYQSYESHMSKILKIPMNHMLDFPHYSHSHIPPTGNSDFKGFMFPPAEPDKLYSYNQEEENWPYIGSKLHKDGEDFYMKANADDFPLDPFRLEQHRIVHYYHSIEQLKDSGILREQHSQYYLDSGGRRINLMGGLFLDKPLTVLEPTNFYVDGPCQVQPVTSTVLFALNCENINFQVPLPDPTQTYRFEGFFTARNSFKKSNPFHMAIIGNLAVSKLDTSVFTSPSEIIYNNQFIPTGPQADYYYRITMDDSTSSYIEEFGS
jgi:hypothetical protein